MSKNKVIVVGAMYSLNFGDGIICNTVSKIINNEYNCETVIFGISGKDKFPDINKIGKNKKYIKNKLLKIFPINKYVMMRSRIALRKKLEELNKAEFKGLVFAGGQLFMDCFIDYICEIVKWAETNKIPVFFNACGIGKINCLNKLKLKKTLKRDIVEGITVRDGIDKFKKMFEINKVQQVFDPVVEISNYYNPQVDEKKKLGIGIIHPINFRKNCVNISVEQYEKIIQIIIEYCKVKKIEFEMFTNGDLMDFEFCKKMAKKFELNNVCERPINPDDLISIINKYEKIVSCRLHSLIIASSYNIPILALVWDLKVREFMKNINKEDCCISMEKMPSENYIIESLDSLMENKVEYCYDKYNLSSKSLNVFFDKIR